MISFKVHLFICKLCSHLKCEMQQELSHTSSYSILSNPNLYWGWYIVSSSLLTQGAACCSVVSIVASRWKYYRIQYIRDFYVDFPDTCVSSTSSAVKYLPASWVLSLFLHICHTYMCHSTAHSRIRPLGCEGCGLKDLQVY